MPSIAINRRFRGPPTSANGGYVCGLVANVIGGSGEVTVRAPPPLDQPLEIVLAPTDRWSSAPHKRCWRPG
jgi:hypothetical protein